MTEYFEDLTLEEVAYTEKVVALINSNSEELISNGEIGHARILINQMMLRATSSLHIFSNFLKPEIYNNPRILSAMKKLVERGNVCVKILLHHPELVSNNNEFIKICEKYNKCEIYQVKDPDEDQLKAHFITMDDKAYRFCANSHPDYLNALEQSATVSESISLDASDSIKAIASFNRPQNARNLNRRFKRFLNDASPYISLSQ